MLSESDFALQALSDKDTITKKSTLVKSFKYHEDIKRAERELLHLKEIIKLASKNKTKIHLLKQNEQNIGLIALSVASLNQSPALQIDYLFADYPLRKQQIEELKIKISEYLVLYAVNIAREIRQKAGLRYIILYPDSQSKELIENYQKMGFKQFTKEWLFVEF